MDVENIWQRIQALPGSMQQILAKDQAALNELDFLWFTTTGNHLKEGCRDCRIRAYHEVTNITYQKLIQMENQKFKMKAGSLVYFNHQHYTDKTINDEVAIQMIESNPANLDLFDEYPTGENGEVVLEQTVEGTLSDEQKASVHKKGNFYYYTNEAGEDVKTTKAFLTANGVDLKTVTTKE